MAKNRDWISKQPLRGRPDAALSRRKFLKVSLAGAASVGAAGLSVEAVRAQMRAPGTTPKSTARYQDAPNRGRRCARCVHFLAPDRCAIVAGTISPNGWCRFYERRTARRSGNGGY